MGTAYESNGTHKDLILTMTMSPTHASIPYRQSKTQKKDHGYIVILHLLTVITLLLHMLAIAKLFKASKLLIVFPRALILCLSKVSSLVLNTPAYFHAFS